MNQSSKFACHMVLATLAFAGLTSSPALADTPSHARSQVAMESLELAHEGFLESKPARRPYSKTLTFTLSTTTPAPPSTTDGKYVVKQMIGRPKGRINETGNAARSSR